MSGAHSQNRTQDLPYLLSTFATEISDADEEAFGLFSTYRNASDLGMLSKEDMVEISIGERDFVLNQSRSLLSGKRKGGTTGAVIWTVSPLFAAWISNPSRPILRHQLLNLNSTVLELGAGVSPLTALSLSPSVARYMLSDQDYVLKILQSNVACNTDDQHSSRRVERRSNKSKTTKVASRVKSNIETMELDWETTEPASVLSYLSSPSNMSDDQVHPVDAIIATDCIFNPSIIAPFVNMLAALSSPPQSSPSSQTPVVSIIAQQLRAPDVFTAWLEATIARFRVWRVDEGEMGMEGLGIERGFVVHVCLLR